MNKIVKIAVKIVCVCLALLFAFSLGWLGNIYCGRLDSDIDSGTAFKAIIKLNLSNSSYVKLTDEPLKLLYANRDKFIEEYFDSVDEMLLHEHVGFGIKDGVKYHGLWGPFGMFYRTITLEEWDVS